MLKKIFAAAVTFVVLVVLCSVCAFAEREGSFEYKADTDGTAYITGCWQSKDSTVVIPEKLGGLPVGTIGDFAFEYFENLSRIEIPATVKKIGEAAFIGCGSLSNVYFASDANAWYKVFISIDNECLKNAKINYNSCIPLDEVTGFAVSAKTADSVSVKWNADKNAGGYIVERLVSGRWTSVATLKGSSSCSYTFNGLSAGEIYYFRVCSYKTSGTVTVKSDYSALNTATPSSFTPKLTASSTLDTVSLSWDKDSSASGYIIEQKINGVWYQKAKITNNNTTSYKFTGKKEGTAYYYRIKSYNNFSESDYSEVKVCTALSVPEKFEVSKVTCDTITLTWSEQANATGYIIEQKINGLWYQKAKITNNKTVSYTFTGKQDFTTFYYRIKAYTSAVSSDYSNVTVKTLLASPNGLTADVTSSSVTLNWTANTKATGYIIEQKINGVWYQKAKITDKNADKYTFTGKKENIVYYYRIKACNGSSESAYASVTCRTLMSAPKNFKALATTSTIKLSWDACDDATGYIIEQKINGLWYQKAKIQSPTVKTYTFTGKNPGVTYYYRIKAVGKNVDSDYANVTTRTFPV